MRVGGVCVGRKLDPLSRAYPAPSWDKMAREEPKGDNLTSEQQTEGVALSRKKPRSPHYPLHYKCSEVAPFTEPRSMRSPAKESGGKATASQDPDHASRLRPEAGRGGSSIPAGGGLNLGLHAPSTIGGPGFCRVEGNAGISAAKCPANPWSPRSEC